MHSYTEDPDKLNDLVRSADADPDDRECGRIVGWQGEEWALVMWPGNDHPEEEHISNIVVIER